MHRRPNITARNYSSDRVARSLLRPHRLPRTRGWFAPTKCSLDRIARRSSFRRLSDEARSWSAVARPQNYPQFRGAAIQSRRDCGTKPKVARLELPWVSPIWVHNRNAVAIKQEQRWTPPISGRAWPYLVFEPASARSATPSGLLNLFRNDPRVGARSSCQPWALRRNPVGI